jgi:hypothetical protein
MGERTAKPRSDTTGVEERGEGGFGKGRGTPAKRQLPFARHMGVQIIIGEGATSVAAKNAAIAAWDLWRKNPDHERYRILELRFEFITELKMALHIIYSE